MQPQIDAKGTIGQRADAANLAAQIVGREVQSGENAEPARARDFGGQLRPGDAPHSRLNDWVPDVQETRKR